MVIGHCLFVVSLRFEEKRKENQGMHLHPVLIFAFHPSALVILIGWLHGGLVHGYGGREEGMVVAVAVDDDGGGGGRTMGNII